jgi:hypothetical protein
MKNRELRKDRKAGVFSFVIIREARLRAIRGQLSRKAGKISRFFAVFP